MEWIFFNRNVDWFKALQVQPISKSLCVWVGDKLNEAWVETWKKNGEFIRATLVAARGEQ